MRYTVTILGVILAGVLVGCRSTPLEGDTAAARHAFKSGMEDLALAKDPNIGRPAKEEALADFTEAIRLDPKMAEAYYQRANTELDLGRTTDAIRDYSAAMQVRPSLLDARFNRAMAQASLGRYEKAQADLAVLLDQNPEDRDAWKERGVLYDRYYKKSEKQALAAFRKYVELGGDDLEVLERMAELEVD